MASYGAFSSYTPTKDKPVASAIQPEGQKLGKLGYRRAAKVPRTLAATLAAFLLLVLCGYGPCFAGPMEDARSLLDRWTTAFSSHNLDALVELYAADALLLGISSPKLQAGRELIRAYWNAAPETGTRVSITDLHLVALSDAAVTAVGFYQFDLMQEGIRVPKLARFTFVILKRGHDWLIVHHHSSLVPPAPLQ